MKSPDRDAADELERVAQATYEARIRAMFNVEAGQSLGTRIGCTITWDALPETSKDTERAIARAALDASELATLRRRVAEMEEALRAIAGQSVYEDDDYRIQLQDTIDAAREVATAALSPPTRKE